jgi:hypothetical protein
MSRLKQNQNIDRLIQSVTSITENRYSLSEEDLIILQDTLNQLQNLKQKKGKTNNDVLKEVVKIVELLTQFFKKD